MKKHTFYFLVMVLCIMDSFAPIIAGESDLLPNEAMYWRAIDVARRVNKAKYWRLIADDAGRARPRFEFREYEEAMRPIETVDWSPACPAYPIVELLKCHIYGQHYDQLNVRLKSRQSFANLLDSASTAPECLAMLDKFGIRYQSTDIPKQPSRVSELDRSLARLLPLSWWSWWCDFHDSDISVLIKPLPPGTPLYKIETMLGTAERFEQLGLYDYAWKAYVEAIYGGLYPNWMVIGDPPGDKAWLSPETAVLWQRVAENAWRAGEHRLAFEYLAKSAIFGPESQVEKAKAIVQRWKNGTPVKPVAISKTERRKLLEEIIKLYAELKVHPRSLEIIEKYKDWLDNPNELYAQYSKQWKAVVKRRSHGGVAKHLVVFGVKVTKDMDPTSIRVPFACDPARVREVKEKVTKLLQTEADNKPNKHSSQPIRSK